MSSVPIRPCHSCHAPLVSLKHNVINTSSALMDASHMNALMKCVIVSPHRTLTIYLTLWPEAPRSCWKPLAIKWTLSSASMALSSSLSLKRHSCEKKIQASEGFGAQLQLPRRVTGGNSCRKDRNRAPAWKQPLSRWNRKDLGVTGMICFLPLPFVCVLMVWIMKTILVFFSTMPAQEGCFSDGTADILRGIKVSVHRQCLN